MKPSLQPKPRPAVFREAARRVGQKGLFDEFACNALERSHEDRAPIERAFFEAVLMPTHDCKGEPVKSGHPWYAPSYNAEVYDPATARVIGLLLCAILAKEGFQP